MIRSTSQPVDGKDYLFFLGYGSLLIPASATDNVAGVSLPEPFGAGCRQHSGPPVALYV